CWDPGSPTWPPGSTSWSPPSWRCPDQRGAGSFDFRPRLRGQLRRRRMWAECRTFFCSGREFWLESRVQFAGGLVRPQLSGADNVNKLFVAIAAVFVLAAPAFAAEPPA